MGCVKNIVRSLLVSTTGNKLATPEGKVKNKVKAFLKERGVFWFCPVQNGMGVHGTPDFLVCWNGLFVGIETKAPGKKGNITPNQEMQIKKIRESEGLAFVIDNEEQMLEIEKIILSRKE